MRAILFSVLACAAVALGGCYNTGDLGARPFQCTGNQPDCPDNYQCLYLEPGATTSATICGTANGTPQNCICGIQCNTNADCQAVSASSTTCTARKICSQ